MHIPDCPPPASAGGKLNVFLHGLIAISNDHRGIELVIPDVGSDHAYRFGEFLGEVTLPSSPAPYHVTGITGATPAPFSTDHVCTTKQKDICSEASAYARIILPSPIQVFSYLKVNLTDVIEDPLGALQRNSDGTITGTLTPVLQYTFCDPRRVLFGCDPLNVAPVWSTKAGEQGWYMNLHIFAEEDIEHDESHTISGFDAIAGIFDFESAPRLISVSNIPAPTTGKLPSGTTDIEFISLALRTREVGYLGRQVRTQLLNGLDPATIQVSSMGGDPVTCLPLVSQNS